MIFITFTILVNNTIKVTFRQCIKKVTFFQDDSSRSQLNDLLLANHSDYYYTYQPDDTEFIEGPTFANINDDDDDEKLTIIYGDDSDSESDTVPDVDHDILQFIQEKIDEILQNIDIIDIKHANCDSTVKQCGCGCDKLHDGYAGYCNPWLRYSFTFNQSL